MSSRLNNVSGKCYDHEIIEIVPEMVFDGCRFRHCQFVGIGRAYFNECQFIVNEGELVDFPDGCWLRLCMIIPDDEGSNEDDLR